MGRKKSRVWECVSSGAPQGRCDSQGEDPVVPRCSTTGYILPSLRLFVFCRRRGKRAELPVAGLYVITGQFLPSLRLIAFYRHHLVLQPLRISSAR